MANQNVTEENRTAAPQHTSLPPLRRKLNNPQKPTAPQQEVHIPAEPEKLTPQQERMAKIRAALASANHEDAAEQKQAAQSRSAAPLPALQSRSTAKLRRADAAAEAKATAPAAQAAVAVLPERKAEPKAAAPEKQAAAPEKHSSISQKLAAVMPKKHTAAPSGEQTDDGKQNRIISWPVKFAAVSVGALVGVAALGYMLVAMVYNSKFLPHTYINSVSVAGMTEEKAEEKLLSQVTASDLTFVTPDGERAVIAASDFDAAYSIPDGALEEAASENPYSWVSKLFDSTEYSVPYSYSYSTDKLRTLLADYDWGSDTSQDAKIVKNADGTFAIEPETLGDKFDLDMLVSYAAEQIRSGQSVITMEDSGCYEPYRAKVTSDDLADELVIYNHFGACTITFDFDDRQKVVTGDMIVNWVMTDEDGVMQTNDEGQVIFDYEAVTAFVEQMAAETDTYGTDRKFHATVDGWITVPWVDSNAWDKNNCSNYGWRIDQEATVTQLINLMRAAETVTVEPTYTWYGRGYVRATDDIGTTYIEADISEQHLWVYKDGVVVMECDFVSGTETNWERRTPRGICQILDMQPGKYLGTMEVQGYHTWVNYWMAFNNAGCGFHDLGRRAYGGSIYQYNGSHGCLNLSYANAQKLYGIIFVGMPVIVHD